VAGLDVVEEELDVGAERVEHDARRREEAEDLHVAVHAHPEVPLPSRDRDHARGLAYGVDVA